MTRGFFLVVALGVTAAASAAEVDGGEPAPPFALDADSASHMIFKVPHTFSVADAHARLGYLLEYWKGRYGVSVTWLADRAWVDGSIWGVRFKGWIQVGEGEITSEANDPGFFVRGRGHHYVESKLKKYMHPTYAEP
jgi:hypothetical protein